MAKTARQINTKKRVILLIGASFAVLVVAWQNGFCSVKTRENNVVKAVRQTGPAVVNISSQYEIRKKSNPFSGYGMDPMLEQFFQDFFSPELERREKRSSLGSGVIIDGKQALVLTNAHVIEKATTIRVVLDDNREFEAAIVGMDPDSDLAVLKVQSNQPLPAIQMGNSDDIMIGEAVIAIGNPFGFSHTVTTGVVSAVKRSIKTRERVFHEFIQTDASINPGNSGGPLLNIDGELIGINTAIYAQAQGIGFAIPINRAKRIISDLINYGAVVQAWIGLVVQPIDTNLAEYLNIQGDAGVIVSAVEPHSPAAAAGLKEGDIIRSINGFTITNIHSYQSKVNDFSVGQEIAFKIRRNGKIDRFGLKTALFPLDQALKLARQRLGISVSAVDQQTRNRYGIQARSGVLIVNMQRGSHLDRIGVIPGDIIHQINEERVNNLEEFKAAIVRYRNKPSVVIMIERDGHYYYINATMKDQ